MSLWYVGAMLSAVGSVGSNFGVNIQKYSFMKNAKLENDQQKSYTKQPLWLLGLVLVICGSLCDFAALGLAAQSIVAPIGSITLVSNVMFAHWGLKEPLSRRDIIGTCMILTGSTLSVAFGNHSEMSYTQAELREMYVQTGFACYAFIVLTVCVVLYCLIKKLQPLKQQLVDTCHEYEIASAADPKDAPLIRELDLKIAELEIRYEKWEKIHPFCYCALSGCLGAQSILFGKMLAEMIAESLRGNNQMVYPLTYVFLACMLFSIFCQLHFLALGLSFFDALYVVPVFQCFFISVSALGGAAYFSEFARFEVKQIIFYPIGFILTLSGVYILSSREMKSTIHRTDVTPVDSVNQVNEVAVNGEEFSKSLPIADAATPHTLIPSLDECGPDLESGPVEDIRTMNGSTKPKNGDFSIIDEKIDPTYSPVDGIDKPCVGEKYFVPRHELKNSSPFFSSAISPPSTARAYAASMPNELFLQMSDMTPRQISGSVALFSDRRPSTAGDYHDQRMSRFAQQQLREGRNRTRGQAPRRATMDITSTNMNRTNVQYASKRSTWTNEVGLIHAGLAVLGVTAPPETP